MQIFMLIAIVMMTLASSIFVAIVISAMICHIKDNRKKKMEKKVKEDREKCLEKLEECMFLANVNYEKVKKVMSQYKAYLMEE